MLEENHHKVARCTGGKAIHSSTIKHGDFIYENDLKKEDCEEKTTISKLTKCNYMKIDIVGSDRKREPTSDKGMQLISIKDYFKDIL